MEVHSEAITPQNALKLIEMYDVVLDCTDNAPSRYLISDGCVVAGKPLVSGAAIGTDGQLTVYNFGDEGTVSLPGPMLSLCQGLGSAMACSRLALTACQQSDLARLLVA